MLDTPADLGDRNFVRYQPDQLWVTDVERHEAFSQASEWFAAADTVAWVTLPATPSCRKRDQPKVQKCSRGQRAVRACADS